MKRTLFLILSVILLLSTVFAPLQANAATATSKAGIVATSSGSLNVRSGASTGSSIVASLRKGSYVTLLSQTGSWWRVEYAKGQYGYCHGSYISSISGNTAIVATQSGSLNVRSGAGTSYSRIGSLSKGETVIVLSTFGGWSRILYHGTKTGYVSGQYLQSSNTAVSLKVPNFKQTDSRWANVQIGSSGKTMAKIGCATTAIAMMESYRTASIVYPDTMAKKLNYTSTGNVYWPAHYKTVTDSSGYLNRIYDLLKQGKPILFGAKNGYGSQHWVVITGFSGGKISAENFTINDPGSNSRITLQQFLNAYPNFYKYFYY